MPRWAGIDYGTRRIGLALADPGGSIASPATVLEAAGSQAADARRVCEWARINEVTGLVVGLPISMNDTESDQTRLTRAFAEQLARQFAPRRDADSGSCGGSAPQHVELWDERLSSFQADEMMESACVPRSRRKSLRDAFAAAAILQSFLDARGRDADAS